MPQKSWFKSAGNQPEKKKKSQDFPKEDSHHPLQLEQPGQAAISGSPGFNCLGLGIQIAASCSGLLSFACLARRVNAKPYFSGAVSQSMKSSCLKACLEGFCSRCGLALPYAPNLLDMSQLQNKCWLWLYSWVYHAESHHTLSQTRSGVNTAIQHLFSTNTVRRAGICVQNDKVSWPASRQTPVMPKSSIGSGHFETRNSLSIKIVCLEWTASN